MILIIFGEGKNDNHYIGEVFSHLSYGFYEREFNAEEIHPDERYPKESRTIRDFIRLRRGERALLMKSEQGRPQLKSVISNFLFDLANRAVHFGVVLDLDGDPVESIIEDIDEQVQSRSQQSVSVAEYDIVSTNEDFHAIKCKVLNNGNHLDTFGMVAFHEDLETAVGIEGSEPREEREQAIREYVNNNPSYAHLVETALV